MLVKKELHGVVDFLWGEGLELGRLDGKRRGWLSEFITEMLLPFTLVE